MKRCGADKGRQRERERKKTPFMLEEENKKNESEARRGVKITDSK